MNTPVVIIGAGPAGLSCATTLANAGQNVIILDENTQPGGQYYRQLPQTFSADYHRLPHDRSGFDTLSAVLSHPKVRYLRATTMWSAISPNQIAYTSREGSGRLDARAVVLATGAQDMPFPFPGWTLPGVISAGGCLNMIKGQGQIPQGRVVVAGNGPLILVTAASLVAAGATVTAIFEAQNAAKLIPAVAYGAISSPGILWQAMSYRTRLLTRNTPLHFGQMIAGAEGDERLEQVRIAPVGSDGRPVIASQTTIDADVLVTGYGLTPGSEPARLFGCRMTMDPALNGAVPERSATLETSVKGVYAIGDGAGIGGVHVAITEGRIAAQAILGETINATGSYHRRDAFRRKLNLAYRPERTLSAATPDTIVCRCESLRLSELQNHPRLKTGNLDALKTATRLGMGRCQGRNCLPSVPRLLNLPDHDFTTRPRVRPPLRPVPLQQLAADADALPVKEPDEPLITTPGDPS